MDPEPGKFELGLSAYALIWHCLIFFSSRPNEFSPGPLGVGVSLALPSHKHIFVRKPIAIKTRSCQGKADLCAPPWTMTCWRGRVICFFFLIYVERNIFCLFASFSLRVEDSEERQLAIKAIGTDKQSASSSSSSSSIERSGRACGSTMSSVLHIDAEGKLVIWRQADLDTLLIGRGQDAFDARQQVRSLLIRDVDEIREECPVLPCLRELTIRVDGQKLQRFPSALRASALPSLQRLTLICDGNYAGAVWVWPALKGCFDHLREITVEYFAMPMDILDPLLRQLPSLTTLHLRRNGIDNRRCQILAQILRQHAYLNLTQLNLEGNHIGAQGCLHLRQVIQQHACPNLTRLDLHDNDIGTEGCASLAGAMREPYPPAMARIRLGLESLGADNCVTVARTLGRLPCSYLTHLDLGANGIGTEGCMHLAKALREHACPGLLELFLPQNRICSVGFADLVHSLCEGCPAIRELHLWSNRIDILPDALRMLRSLVLLDVSDTPVDTIPPTLYGLILQLETLTIDRTVLVSRLPRACRSDLNALKGYLRQLQQQS